MHIPNLSITNDLVTIRILDTKYNYSNKKIMPCKWILRINGFFCTYKMCTKMKEQNGIKLQGQVFKVLIT